MKNLVLSITAITVMGIILSTSTVTYAQSAKPAQSTKPHKIGLIDMAHIFKNYEKFTDQRVAIEEELKKTSEGAVAQRDRIQGMQAELKELKPTSPDYSKKEAEVASAVAAFQAEANRIKRELVIKEAELYKQTYLEVTDIISKYAKTFDYTLILRYSQESVEADDGPQDVMRKMGSQVVYHEPGDDITLSVLEYMNKQYKATAGRTSSGRSTK